MSQMNQTPDGTKPGDTVPMATRGRIVDYHETISPKRVLSALVTAVTGERLTLHVFDPCRSEPSLRHGVPHKIQAGSAEAHWTWPKRVEPRPIRVG